MGVISACFMIFPYFFNVFVNIQEYAHYANKIICIFDHDIKGLCLYFNMIIIVAVFDK